MAAADARAPQRPAVRRRRLLLASAVAALAVGFGSAGMTRATEYARAVRYLGAERPLASGPYTAARRDLLIPVQGWGDVAVALWYPSDAPRGSWMERGMQRIARPTSASALENAPWTAGRPANPLILHFPSWFNLRSETSFTAAELASHGYVVAAVDDILHLARPDWLPDDVRRAEFAFTSPAAFDASRDRARSRAEAEARFGSAVIDALLSSRSVGPHLDAARIAVSGFSFGGAAALELAVRDRRIRAIVNLDGLVLGRAEAVGIALPYLYLSADIAPPTAEELRDPDLARRYDRMMDGVVIAFQQRQATRPDNHTVIVRDTVHTDFTDRLIMPAFREPPRPAGFDRVAVWRRINAELRGFLETHLGPMADAAGRRSNSPKPAFDAADSHSRA